MDVKIRSYPSSLAGLGILTCAWCQPVGKRTVRRISVNARVNAYAG